MRKFKMTLLSSVMTASVSVFLIVGMVFAINTFPNKLNTWRNGEVVESGWGNSLEKRIGVIGSTDPDSLTYEVSQLELGIFELGNNEWLKATDNAGTGTINMSKINTSDEIETGAKLNADEGVEITYAGTANGLNVYSNVDASVSSPLVDIHADNSAFDQDVFKVVNDGVQQTAYLQANTNRGNYVHGVEIDDNQTSGSNASFAILDSNINANFGTVYIVGERTGQMFELDMNGRGQIFDMNQDVTNSVWSAGGFKYVGTSVVSDAATYTKSGSIFDITSDVIETLGTITDSAIVLDINQTHADATGNVVDITNSGTGNDIVAPNFTLKSGTMSLGIDADTIADSGDGNPATHSLAPSTSYVSLTCNDANNCTITMNETGAVDGQIVRIVNVSANVCDFSDTSGVSELAGNWAMGQYDTLELIYATDRFVEIGRSGN